MYLYDFDDYKEEIVEIKAEFESTPIRRAAIRCPGCNNWFSNWDIAENEMRYEYEICGARCRCPKCDKGFKISYKSKVEETSEIPKCLVKKVRWE